MATALPPVGHRELLVRLLSWSLIASCFTLAILHWSATHGRLIVPPTYDDVGYLSDGLLRRETLYQDGVAGLVSEHVRRPPHSPFSSYLALLAFLVFGAHDWAPYAANGVIIIAILAFVDHLLRRHPWWVRAAGYVIALSVPLAGETVAEFRPDIACGLFTAIGVVLLLGEPLVPSDSFRRRLAGACFGLALLFKPTAFIFTLGILGLSLAIETVTGRLQSRPFHPGRIASDWLEVLWPVAVLGIPHFLLTGRYYLDYFRWHIVGPDHPWRYQATLSDQLRYYLDGEGGRIQLGHHLYLFAALVGIGLAFALARRRQAEWAALARQLIVLAAAYAVPALNPVKQIFFAITFSFLLLFLAIQVLGTLLSAEGRRPLVAAAVGAVTVAAVFCAHPPAAWGSRSDPDVRRRNALVNEIQATLRQLATKQPTEVFVASPGRLNPDLLQYAALRDGDALRYRFLCGPPRPCLYLSDDPGLFLNEMQPADFVLIGEPGNSESVTGLPSARLQAPLLVSLRSRPDYVEQASFPTLNGKAYLLFEKLGAFGGWTAAEGFLPEEGPYPQWQLPVVRWGCAPSSVLTVHDQRGGRRRLTIKGRSDVPGQEMTIALDGREVARLALPTAGQFEEADVPLILGPGPHTIKFGYSQAIPDAQGIQRAVLFERIQIRPEPTPAP